MASSGVNVLRYLALVSGVGYGLYHQSAIKAQERTAKANHEFQHQSSLISKAKAEYTKKTMPKEKAGSGGGVISDPDDPKFDLEAFLTLKMADETKG